MVVIHKNGGPYIHLYDLPGGSLEEYESLSDAVKREFLEETGLEIEIVKKLGVVDFMLSSDWRGSTQVHHICVYFLVKKVGGQLTIPNQFEGQDSLGALWVTEHEVSMENASPLVLQAFEWVKKGELHADVELFEDWKVNR
ncbi:NUDIX hydrolase [Ectobacillus sp. JY-23]|nr:NUDIX hydrolase [Ectobacillus sp. JY-23]